MNFRRPSGRRFAYIITLSLASQVTICEMLSLVVGRYVHHVLKLSTVRQDRVEQEMNIAIVRPNKPNEPACRVYWLHETYSTAVFSVPFHHTRQQLAYCDLLPNIQKRLVWNDGHVSMFHSYDIPGNVHASTLHLQTALVCCSQEHSSLQILSLTSGEFTFLFPTLRLSHVAHMEILHSCCPVPSRIDLSLVGFIVMLPTCQGFTTTIESGRFTYRRSPKELFGTTSLQRFHYY